MTFSCLAGLLVANFFEKLDMTATAVVYVTFEIISKLEFQVYLSVLKASFVSSIFRRRLSYFN